MDRYADRPLRIGSFSAASNVTGILSDADVIAALLHARGALSFWDYAAAGPYVPIRARESALGAGDHKDAIFLSPHKFIGGPQTPGVLVVRRDLVRNRVPTVPGGGTVAFVAGGGACRKPRSTSCDQVIFVDQATGAGLSSDAVPRKIDRLG